MINPFEHIKLEYLKEGNQRELAEIIGIEAYIKLIQHFSGEMIYVADKDQTLIRCKVPIIKELAKTTDHQEICHAFNISVRKYDKIVQGYKG